MSSICYSGSNESKLLRQAQAENPDGFEILSIQRSGFWRWRKVLLIVKPLSPAPQQEMSRIRLLSAIYSMREQRLVQAAQLDAMDRAFDFNPQQRL